MIWRDPGGNAPWSAWADWLGIPRMTFFAVLGGLIARGEHHRRVFELLCPGIDLAHERAARVAAGHSEHFERTDFYPDAMPCLAAAATGGLPDRPGRQSARRG